MKELAVAYIDFLNNLKVIKKPRMPKVDVDAYNEVKYRDAVRSIMQDFEAVNDFRIYEQFLKGENGSK